MAYLTNYSFNKLVEMTEVKNINRIDLQFFTKNIFDNQYLYYFFNQFELKKLFRSKIILSDDKSYVLTYKEVPARIDNGDFVLPVEGKVKYHIKLDCKALNRGFKNFFMPEVVLRYKLDEPLKHQELIDEVRNWFNKNNYTIQRYENHEIIDLEITRNFNSYFPSKYNIDKIVISDKLDNNFQWYISKKTENTDIKTEFDYNVFLEKITLLIKKRHILCDTLIKDNLSNFDYMLKFSDNEIIQQIENGKLFDIGINYIENFNLIKLKEFWEIHIALKNEAMSILSDYLKWTYNLKEKQFDVIYLENYNLEKCLICSKN